MVASHAAQRPLGIQLSLGQRLTSLLLLPPATDPGSTAEQFPEQSACGQVAAKLRGLNSQPWVHVRRASAGKWCSPQRIKLLLQGRDAGILLLSAGRVCINRLL